MSRSSLRKPKNNFSYTIPRTSLIWLLSAVVAVILPHLGRMPIWLAALCAFGVIGRILIFQGRISYPGKVIKSLIVFATLTAMTIQYGRDILALEATVSILIVGIALKLLEMHRKADVLLVIYLCYFALVAEFIYTQAIPIAIYLGFCTVLITSALLSLHQTQEYQRPLRTLKMVVQIMLQSIPIMMALFLLFPRISPMWSVSTQSTTALSGLSSNMSPGDIGELVSSAEVAFRVQFEGDVPSNSQLYWRALSLDVFNGRSWSRSQGADEQILGKNVEVRTSWFEEIEYLSEIVDYNVIMEPTNQSWIYTLKVPQIDDQRFIMRRDYQIESMREISQRFSYDVRSYLDNKVETKLTVDSLRHNLTIPERGNDRSREFALQLREQSDSVESFVVSVLGHFRQQEFFYTLTPPLLGSDPIDDFMFNTHRGFCEHYSSAFTFMMRAAGVPARIVTGYQGGELNPYDNALTVRQYDAHAWAEIWLEGQGWVRFDPTAAVAPERIEMGSQFAFQEEDSFLSDMGFSMLRFRNSRFLNDLRLRIEMLDYKWNRFVLNYDRQMQEEFFGRLFDNVTRQKMIASVLAFIALIVALMGTVLLRKSKKDSMNPATVLYLRYCKRLANSGFNRLPGETPDGYYERVSLLRPQYKAQMLAITRTYIDLAFKGDEQDNGFIRNMSKLKRLVRKFPRSFK